jgi:fido (protein-threonine AMPylation protein)
MFTRKKTIDNKEYAYIEHSFRIGDSIKKASFYVPKDTKSFDTINKDAIKQIVVPRIAHIKKQKYEQFFRYGEQIKSIEEKKIFFQIYTKILPKSTQREIVNEFLRTFLVNSMAMEGGTISYDIAKAIDEKKKIRVKGINELDIPLYTQLKEAHKKLQKERIRYPKQIKELHGTIYKNIYPFAGEFRKKKVTFGNISDLAKTDDPKNITKGYKKAIEKYYKTKGKVYDFERIIRFHRDFQSVHGFEDGNSRLGRLIMMYQFSTLGYPPLLVRGTQSKAYRLSLIRAINNHDLTSLLKFFNTAYNRTWKKFWLPVLEENVKKSKIIV